MSEQFLILAIILAVSVARSNQLLLSMCGKPADVDNHTSSVASLTDFCTSLAGVPLSRLECSAQIYISILSVHNIQELMTV